MKEIYPKLKAAFILLDKADQILEDNQMINSEGMHEFSKQLDEAIAMVARLMNKAEKMES